MLDAAVEPGHGAPLDHLVLGSPHDPGGVCMGSQAKGRTPNSSGSLTALRGSARRQGLYPKLLRSPRDPSGVCTGSQRVTSQNAGAWLGDSVESGVTWEGQVGCLSSFEQIH